MNAALLPAAEPSPRNPRSRTDSQRDTFLIEYEFDFMVVVSMSLCIEYVNYWNMSQQLHLATWDERVRAVSLVVADLVNKLLFWVGIRAYLQQAVLNRKTTSSRARMVMVAGILFEAACDGLLNSYNFGLPQRSPGAGALHPAPSTPETFLWYFYSFSHLSAGAVGCQLAARLVAFVVVVQFETIFMINVWRNLANGHAPFFGEQALPFYIGRYWSAKLILIFVSVTFTFILQRFRKAIAEAEELQARRSLSQVMFHELRNPLNGTVGHLALAQAALRESRATGESSASTAIAPAVADAQADAQTCTEHALRVLRTLNAIEKYSEQAWPVAPRVADLQAVCSDVATMARPTMAAGVELRCSVALESRPSGHLQIQVQLQPSGSFLALVDDLVLREVLLNLVQNSARFTTAGFVELGCVIERPEKAVDVEGGGGATDAPRCCRFYVRDTGTGIHGEALASLGTKYASIGGVGIGVHLSRRQVEAMGGALLVRSPWSDDGRTGTEFSFTLELEPASAEAAAAHNAGSQAAVVSRSPGGTFSAAPAAPPPSPPLPTKLRVLIADDVTMNLRLLQAALKRVSGGSWRVTAVEVAGEAMTLFEEARRDGDAFDVIIMDEQFDARSENMLGTDVIRRMRAIESGDGPGGRRAAIISCSGHSNDDDSDSVFLDAGADDAWGKPIPSFIDGTMQRRLGEAIARVTR